MADQMWVNAEAAKQTVGKVHKASRELELGVPVVSGLSASQTASKWGVEAAARDFGNTFATSLTEAAAEVEALQRGFAAYTASIDKAVANVEEVDQNALIDFRKEADRYLQAAKAPVEGNGSGFDTTLSAKPSEGASSGPNGFASSREAGSSAASAQPGVDKKSTGEH